MKIFFTKFPIQNLQGTELYATTTLCAIYQLLVSGHVSKGCPPPSKWNMWGFQPRTGTVATCLLRYYWRDRTRKPREGDGFSPLWNKIQKKRSCKRRKIELENELIKQESWECNVRLRGAVWTVGMPSTRVGAGSRVYFVGTRIAATPLAPTSPLPVMAASTILKSWAISVSSVAGCPFESSKKKNPVSQIQRRLSWLRFFHWLYYFVKWGESYNQALGLLRITLTAFSRWDERLGKAVNLESNNGLHTRIGWRSELRHMKKLLKNWRKLKYMKVKELNR